MGAADEKGVYDSNSTETPAPNYGDVSEHQTSWATRVVDSFRRDPNAHATAPTSHGGDDKNYDLENAAAATAESPLARKLKGRHLQMIAIGGSIGMSLSRRLLLASANALRQVPVCSSAPERPWPTVAPPRC